MSNMEKKENVHSPKGNGMAGRAEVHGKGIKDGIKGLSNSKDTVKRLLKYFRPYRARMIFVMVCIVISAVVGAVSSLFIKSLIDDYIAPMLLQAIPDYSGLAKMITKLAGIFAVGVLAAWSQSYLMVNVGQGILRNIRNEMFEHMQTLPIRYFDTNSHGDIMSHYTNDTDTLRQLISVSIPQMLSAVLTIIAVLLSMMYLSIWLTLFALLCVFAVFKVIKLVGGKSGKYFRQQQASVGKINGFIEEMITGQKVIKVFCHEEQTKEEFDRLNEELCQNMGKANAYANILMPIMGNMGYLLYVLIAIVGGALAIVKVPNLTLTGIGILTLGTIASFLQLSRNFIQPISQVSQQINSIVLALAGAERIFKLLDVESERNEGKVTLENTGEGWVWQVPQADGSKKIRSFAGRCQT